MRWKSNKYYIFWVCVCSLRYPACNEHAPHCHLWPVQLYNIFPHYLIESTNKRKLLNTNCVLWFSLWLLSEKSLILIRSKQDIIICVYSSSCKVFIIQDFKETWIFLTDLKKKHSNIKFHENLSSGSWAVPRGQTDRWTYEHDEANGHFSQFCKCTQKLQKVNNGKGKEKMAQKW